MEYNLDALSVDDIKNGCRFDPDTGYTCLICGAEFAQGEVYPLEGRFYEASRAAMLHIKKGHPDYCLSLINAESKYLSLTDNQRTLLTMIHNGMSDNEIAKALEVSPSTVRRQRFMFREKAKQAKMYLAVYQLVAEAKRSEREEMIPVHDNAKMLDERYVTTEGESRKVYEAFFSSLSPLKLKTFPAREKKKIVVLARIAQEFDPKQRYTEKQVNEIIGAIFDDFATLRRYLIAYGFLDRTTNGSAYWRK